MAQTYPWYEVIETDEVEQGDVIEACPVFLPPPDLAEDTLALAEFTWEERDVVVLSQTCDLVKGREKVSDVLLGAVWKRSELTEGYLSTIKGMEETRRGNLPAFHLLASCDLPGWERELRIVDFRRLYSLPLAFLRKRGSTRGPRLRLLPPYREHLSQALAQFFMRVGLPVDVPAFR